LTGCKLAFDLILRDVWSTGHLAVADREGKTRSAFSNAKKPLRRRSSA
jgi:hypothetical protein